MEVNGFDFTEYSKQGFLFTPESYNGEYESIGLIEVAFYPPVTKDTLRINEEKWDSWLRSEFSRWYVGVISSNELLDSLYNYTNRMGADAVINLRISETEPKTNGVVLYSGIKASGFAIKRK
jgi:hypothetical protein